MTTEANDMDASPLFGTLLRRLRMQRGWSLRDLAERIAFNRGYIGKVEQREKFPDRQFAELADRALEAAGVLVAAWQRDATDREDAAKAGRLVVASTRDSLRLIAADEEHLDLDDLDREARTLAVDYLASTPIPMLERGVELRSEALRRLRQHHYAPHDLADLYLTLGRLQGVLAYAALDAGDPKAAMTHAEAAWVCADRARDNELRVWVRGTQSLIARFEGDYNKAMGYVLQGLTYETPGTGELRLLSGYAQCHANLGDSRGANDALNLALTKRERLSTPDALGGIFEFSEAKQRYYAGSSLIWLDGGRDAERAAREAGQAIKIWENASPESRSLDDEALAHVYQATAYLQLGQLDAAAQAVAPVLHLPPERQISWIRKRLARFADLLRDTRFTGSREALDLYDEIQALAA